MHRSIPTIGRGSDGVLRQSADPARHANWGVLFLLALAAVALTPAAAWAWTPGTHVFLADAVLRYLSLVPSGVAALLARYPLDFIYGSIAADTTIAKKYAPEGRHCHSWRVGLEIRDRARDDALRAFGFGYLAHLAADTVAHNFFVPLQLARTATTSAIGHSYWESRFETHLPERSARRARDVILLDHSRSDEHLDGILSPTLFSTGTNRRIFRGMVRAADNENWQRVFQMVLRTEPMGSRRRGRVGAPGSQFRLHRRLPARDDASEPCAYDPSGDTALRDAKRIRRSALMAGGAVAANLSALRAFRLPESVLMHAASMPTPLLREPTTGGGSAGVRRAG